MIKFSLKLYHHNYSDSAKAMQDGTKWHKICYLWNVVKL